MYFNSKCLAYLLKIWRERYIIKIHLFCTEHSAYFLRYALTFPLHPNCFPLQSKIFLPQANHFPADSKSYHEPIPLFYIDYAREYNDYKSSDSYITIIFGCSKVKDNFFSLYYKVYHKNDIF